MKEFELVTVRQMFCLVFLQQGTLKDFDFFVCLFLTKKSIFERNEFWLQRLLQRNTYWPQLALTWWEQFRFSKVDVWKDLSHFPSSLQGYRRDDSSKENPRCAKASKGSKVSRLSPAAAYEGICSAEWGSSIDLVRATRLCEKAQGKAKSIYHKFIA